jgi:hypothetical protein
MVAQQPGEIAASLDAVLRTDETVGTHDAGWPIARLL